jgi:hypothetical protein
MSSITPLLSRPHVMGFEARAGLESFARTLCGSLGLPPVKVKWADVSTAAISQGGTMYLSDIGDATKVPRNILARYAGYIVHELLHRKYTDFKARDLRRYVDRLHNALEDAWIERKAIASGLTGNVEPLLHTLLRGLIDEAKGVDFAALENLPFSLAVYARRYGVNVPVPAALLPVWQEAAQRLDACTSSHDTLELARWVFEQIKSAAQDQGQDQGQPGQDGEPQDAEGEGEGQAEGDGGGEAEGEGQGEAQGEAQGEGKGSAEGEGEGEGSGKAAGQGEGEGEPADAGPVTKAPTEHQGAREVEPGLPRDDAAPGGSYSSTEVLRSGAPDLMPFEAWATDVPVPAALRYQVRRLFENSAREWREGGFRSGTLHRPALAKVATGQAEVFARRFAEDGVDSAVAILLDVSGSMFPSTMARSILRQGKATWEAIQSPPPSKSRISTAVGCTSVLLNTLAQAGAESMVITFGTESRIIKTWAQPWRKVLPTLRAISYEGDTNDFAGCRYATEALMRHPAQRKVLIAITDGEGEYRTHKQVEAARALGITVLALGIQMDASETYGAGTVRVDQVADLGSVALDRLAKAA